MSDLEKAWKAFEKNDISAYEYMRAHGYFELTKIKAHALPQRRRDDHRRLLHHEDAGPRFSDVDEEGENLHQQRRPARRCLGCGEQQDHGLLQTLNV